MAFCLPEQDDCSQADPEFHQAGVSVHGCVKAMNVASPATELFYSGQEERNYASLCSDDDGEWKDEVVIRISDLADAETQIGQHEALHSDTEHTQVHHKLPATRLASEPRLGPVRHSDMGLAATTSVPTFQLDDDSATTDTGVDSTVRFATDAKTDDGQGIRKIRDFSKERATRSEALVKAGERPQGRGRILELGRSIANVLAKPFRRRGRRRGEKPKGDKPQTPETNTAAPQRLEDTAKMEESRLPAEELISKQFPAKRLTKHTTNERVIPRATTAQTS